MCILISNDVTNILEGQTLRKNNNGVADTPRIREVQMEYRLNLWMTAT